ncbi:hypothetical protein BH18ACT9_BH18ACT9_21580 [soil metagenome]
MRRVELEQRAKQPSGRLAAGHQAELPLGPALALDSRVTALAPRHVRPGTLLCGLVELAVDQGSDRGTEVTTERDHHVAWGVNRVG